MGPTDLDYVTHRNLSASFGFGVIGDDHQSEAVIEAVALDRG